MRETIGLDQAKSRLWRVLRGQKSRLQFYPQGFHLEWLYLLQTQEILDLFDDFVSILTSGYSLNVGLVLLSSDQLQARL